MNGEDRRPGAPQDRPWSLELLADLHAGALDQAESDDLLVRARQDPRSGAVLDALDSTTAELGDLPSPQLPADVAARLDSALDDEVRAHFRPVSPARPAEGHPEEPSEEPFGRAPAAVTDMHRRRRRRRGGLGAAIVTAAAAATGIFVLSSPSLDSPQQAAPPPSSGSHGSLALEGQQVALTSSQFSQVLRSDQYGPLADQRKLAGCLQANGVSGKPMGARHITLNGRPAQLLVLPTGNIGQFRLLAVGPECSRDDPATVSSTTFGG